MPGKKQRASSVPSGSPCLNRPSDELQAALTGAEVTAIETWIETRRVSDAMREKLATLMMAETMAQKGKWFEREGASVAACTAAGDDFLHRQSLRRMPSKNGLPD